MDKIETLKQVVAQRRGERKEQLRKAFTSILDEDVDTYPVIIEKIVDELLKEVSMRTPLK